MALSWPECLSVCLRAARTNTPTVAALVGSTLAHKRGLGDELASRPGSIRGFLAGWLCEVASADAAEHVLAWPSSPRAAVRSAASLLREEHCGC